MAAVSLFWNANIAATTSCENAVFDLERTDSIKRVLKKSQVLQGLWTSEKELQEMWIVISQSIAIKNDGPGCDSS